MERTERETQLIHGVNALTERQLLLVERIVYALQVPPQCTLHPDSDFLTASDLDAFGDVLRIHHLFSHEPFSKDKFEFAFESIMSSGRHDVHLAARGNRGFDILMDDKRVSLKTEASAAIKRDTLHISKFMELGGGQWGDNPDDLIGLLRQFINVLDLIDRIFVLRLLEKGSPDYLYELVEIPKALLGKAIDGRLEMKIDSSQHPKPGYCHIEVDGMTSFSLYFDGGGERKLQIKGLRKELCMVHATWRFPRGQ